LNSINQKEEIMRRLTTFLNVLNEIKPNRLAALLSLFMEKRLFSFSEIKALFGNEYPSSVVSYHIRALEKANIIVNERKLDVSSGKARSSFYRLTDDGELIINALLNAADEWRKHKEKKEKVENHEYS
jgi:DNA-binding MarR family transcriptional regulator